MFSRITPINSLIGMGGIPTALAEIYNYIDYLIPQISQIGMDDCVYFLKKRILIFVKFVRKHLCYLWFNGLNTNATNIFHE